MKKQKRKIFYLYHQRNYWLLISNADIKIGDWMADAFNVYKAPSIEGFVGFYKVEASTAKNFIGLPYIKPADVIKFDKFKVIKVKVATFDNGSVKTIKNYIEIKPKTFYNYDS